MSAYTDLYEKIASMPGLKHGPGEDGGDEKFDPTKSELLDWLLANLDQRTVMTVFLFRVLQKSGAVYFDQAKRLWCGRSVSQYAKVKAERAAAREEKKRQAAAAKEAAKKKPGRARRIRGDLLTTSIRSFEIDYDRRPTSSELLAYVVNPANWDYDDDKKPIQVSANTFYIRLREARALPEAHPDHIFTTTVTREGHEVDELSVADRKPKPQSLP